MPADEEWLDHEANTVDEQCVLDELGVASDYEHLGLKWLGESRKVTVMRLRSPFLTNGRISRPVGNIIVPQLGKPSTFVSKSITSNYMGG